MLDLEFPRRRWSVILYLYFACVSASMGQPVALSPRWKVNYLAQAGGKAVESTAVPMPGESMMVVVIAAEANPSGLSLQLGNRPVPVKLIGHDPVSRLGFIQVAGGDNVPKAMDWVADVGVSSRATLHSLESDGAAKCHTSGWVKQVGGKILPLALLRVSFNRAVPAPGTPLVDDAGRVVAIVFQSEGSGNTGYAMPAEAVHRVRKDVCNGGILKRGWLGLALRAESQIPQISRVLTDSPAAAAGIKPNDVLLSIDSRQISDYADAANAFFYLVPGQPVRVKLLRDAEKYEFTLTPTSPKG